MPAPVKKVSFGASESYDMSNQRPSRGCAKGAPPGSGQKKVSKKLSCWNCYKLYFKNEESDRFVAGNKTFCTERCFNVYKKAHSMTCQLEGCDKSFLKAQGEYIHLKWFCNDECAEKDPETKSIIDQIAS